MKSGFWLCMIGMIFFSCRAATIKAPSLSVDSDSLHIGEIKFQDSAGLKYTLFNRGDILLEIKNVGTSCGCSKARLSDSLIKPGGSAELNIGYKATDTGFIKKHIVLETNGDPMYRTLVFTGYVVRDKSKDTVSHDGFYNPRTARDASVRPN